MMSRIAKYSMSLLVVFLALGFYCQVSTAATIHILEDWTELYTKVGYSKFPDVYSKQYSGPTKSAPGSLTQNATLIAEPDEDWNYNIVGSGEMGHDRGVTIIFARAESYGWSGVGASNNHDVVDSFAETPENMEAYRSGFAFSYASLKLEFEVIEGNSNLIWRVMRYEPSSFVDAFLILEDMTAGITVAEMFATWTGSFSEEHRSSFTLLDRHKYSLFTSITNTATDDSGTSINLVYTDYPLARPVPEPGTLSLMSFMVILLIFRSLPKRSSR